VEASLNLLLQIVQALAVLLLGIGMIMVALTFRDLRRSMGAIEKSLGDIGRDARPVLDRARAIGENINYIVMSMRKEVDRVSDTVSHANDRLEAALATAEERVQELAALIEVVQGEVEDTVLSATSALRGIRTGAKVLRSGLRRNDDDEQDPEEPED